MQYIYCGKVDIKESEVLPFKKILSTLKIEINLEDHHRISSHPHTKPAATVTSNQNQQQDQSVNEIQIKEEKFDDDENCVQVLDSEFMDCSSDYQAPEIDMSSPSLSQNYSLPNLHSFKPSRTPRIGRISNGHEAPLSRHRTKLEAVVRSRDHRHFMDLNPLDCPFCMKTSSTNKHRNEHVKYCTLNPDRIVSKCHYCDKNFCDPYYVRKHMKTIHGDKEAGEPLKKKNN